jgi:hypothetical protein
LAERRDVGEEDLDFAEGAEPVDGGGGEAVSA